MFTARYELGLQVNSLPFVSKGINTRIDQPIAEAATYTTNNNHRRRTNIYASSGIRTRSPSNQAAADLRPSINSDQLVPLSFISVLRFFAFCVLSFSISIPPFILLTTPSVSHHVFLVPVFRQQKNSKVILQVEHSSIPASKR